MITQYGAIAYRIAEERLRILLITSRDTGRWVIPRGNPMRGLLPHEAAAREAFEEGGVHGSVEATMLGRYHYRKRRKDGSVDHADVHVFPLLVTSEAEIWPEMQERSRDWFPPEAAAELVDEPALRRLILGLVSDGKRLVGSPTPCYGSPPQRGNRMLKLFHAIMPKETRFFDMFSSHAEILVAGAEVMGRMLAGTESIEAACLKIADLEQQADDITRDVLHAVRRTFITPFDRSAITGLISSMDDAIDEMQKTAKAITLFEVQTFEPEMREMSGLAEQAARLVMEAVPLLRSVGRNHSQLDSLTERIVHFEEDADHLHEAGLKELFLAKRNTDAMEFIVRREIYSHLERLLDRFEDVANEIQGIVIDHA
ncbi:DUF47 family protein [Sphingosinicella sp. GR2756]|uniref:DUF47 family protein n=1 Tax=Sphingosinicella rhizophila TaxID=3050082 RepID=A0ABU3Q3R6_9SPHN|nr:DUF47 family protein [Sphingosinicella sp. GR2756]MDT9597595.1 DUF47 family protein [Sphingosinicella sp. GR2756]